MFQTPIIEHTLRSKYRSEPTGRKVSRRGTKFYTWEFMYEDHAWDGDLRFGPTGVMKRICLEIVCPYWMLQTLYAIPFDPELRKTHPGLLTCDTWLDVMQLSSNCWVHDQRDGTVEVVKGNGQNSWFRTVENSITGLIETVIVDRFADDYRIVKPGEGR